MSMPGKTPTFFSTDSFTIQVGLSEEHISRSTALAVLAAALCSVVVVGDCIGCDRTCPYVSLEDKTAFVLQPAVMCCFKFLSLTTAKQ